MKFEIQDSTQDMIISIDGAELNWLEKVSGGYWWVCKPKLESQKNIGMFIGREPNDRRFENITPLDLGTKILETEIALNPIYHINLGNPAYESIKNTENSRERMLGGSSLIVKLED